MNATEHRGALLRVVAGFAIHRTPARLRFAVRAQGWEPIDANTQSVDPSVIADATALASRGFDALLLGLPGYPEVLAQSTAAPPALIYIGDASLLSGHSVGVCGSRRASDRGLEAAAQVAEVAAELGLTLVAGNARGVDRVAQARAGELRASVVAVLPEGVLTTGLSAESLTFPTSQLFASEFPPRQPWSVGAAMARNKTIVSLTDALVVIEPGGTGGTYEAAIEGLRRKTAVLLFAPGGVMTDGSDLLRGKGARVVTTRDDLAAQLGQLSRGRQAMLWT